MGLYDFIKSAGKALGIGDDEGPTAEALKKELDSHNIGSEKLSVEVKGDRAIIKALEKAIVAVGNTVGISQVESSVKVPVAKEPRFYTVKKGDTLWEIAVEVYGKGNGAKNKMIFQANKPMLKSANKIYPGQVLRIPEA
jgi:nucleoid-associated protein YgaU